MRILKLCLWILTGMIMITACSTAPDQDTRFFVSNISALQHTIQIKKDTALVISQDVKPGGREFFDLAPGKYSAFVYDTGSISLYEIRNFMVSPPDTINKKSNPYQYLELMKGARQMVISLDFLYDGNSYSNAMARSMMKDKSGPTIIQSYEANQFHSIEEKYALSSYVNFRDFTIGMDIPDKAKAREYVYGFLSIPPDKLENKEVWMDFILEEIKKHSK